MKLSVITINYNNRDGLQKTIESVVNQTFKDFEYIIIDGGSTDGSVDVIKEHVDRIDYWVSEPDKGIYNAMNKGIDIAKGEYCIFMNSGDLFYNDDIVFNIVPELDGTDFVYGNTFNSNGYIQPHFKDITLKTLYFTALAHQSTFIKTALLKQYHYDESFKIVADWKFCLQTLILDNSSYKGVDIIISVFDIYGLSNSNREDLLIERKKVLKSLFPTRVLDDMELLVNGRTYEDKLYIRIKQSKYNKFFYRFNVLIIKLFSLFKKNSIHEFPNKI